MASNQKIKVMIVDDSIFFREFMSRSLSTDASIEVVGLASDAYEAKEKIDRLQPHVITLDMEMPKMRGTDFLRMIRPKYPNIQVVVISSNPNNVFEALSAGAVDFAAKPNTQMHIDNATFLREVVTKIKIASVSRTARKTPAAVPPAVPVRESSAGKKIPPVRPDGAALLKKIPDSIQITNPKAVIAIGASTGGTEAILSVIKDLPNTTPGIVIVQHMPPVFTRLYAERLDKTCKMQVREAQNGDRVETGMVLIAPGDKHMRLRADARGYFVQCAEGEKVSGHCPSVDVLFESVAKCAGSNAIGIILTGMGSDGAKFLLEMKKAGAHTIGQNQASCVVYGMPMVAFNIGAVREQLPLGDIPNAIIKKLTRQANPQ